MSEVGPRPAGTVLRAGGGTYDVSLDSGSTIEAVLRGRLKLEQRTGDRLVAGDRVRIGIQADGTHTIESVEPRRSQLARRAPGRGSGRARIIVANVDQIVIVFAAAQPEPHLRMLDRFLVLAEANALPALIVVNKTELVDAAGVSATYAPYRAAGYAVLGTSVIAGHGLEMLRERLCGRESVLTGPSGVGKSSLLNALEPGLGLRVGELREAAQKGRHTTVTARLVPLGCGGFVVDTPGLRELGFWGIDQAALASLFPEFRARAGQCRFVRSCSHVHEPGCAIRAAVEHGEIAQQRYDSFLAMRED